MKRRTAIASLLLAALVYTPLAMAQQPLAPGDWSAVQHLPPGNELVIQLKDGRSVKGKMTSVTSDELSFTRKSQSETVRRDSISQIHHLKRKAEKGKYAAIGAGIGAGAGLGIGLAKRIRHRSMTAKSIRKWEPFWAPVSERLAAFCLGRRVESVC